MTFYSIGHCQVDINSVFQIEAYKNYTRGKQQPNFVVGRMNWGNVEICWGSEQTDNLDHVLVNSIMQ